MSSSTDKNIFPSYYNVSRPSTASLSERARAASAVLRNPRQSMNILRSDSAKRGVRKVFVPELNEKVEVKSNMPVASVDVNALKQHDPLDKLRKALAKQNLPIPPELQPQPEDEEERKAYMKLPRVQGQIRAPFVPSRLLKPTETAARRLSLGMPDIAYSEQFVKDMDAALQEAASQRSTASTSTQYGGTNFFW